MTFVRPVGFVPAGPIRFFRNIRRGEHFAAAGVLAALNVQADQIVAAVRYQPLSDAVFGAAGISVIIWAAMVAAWKIGAEDCHPFSGKRDYSVLAAIIALSFIPISHAAQAGLLLCAGYMVATAAPADAQRRSAFVLLALTGPLIWGRLILNLFGVPILALDAHLVGAAIGSQVDGNVVQFAGGGGKQFLIGGACSSVHNMSLALLLWTTAAMLFRIRIDRRYVLTGMAMVVVMFVLNVLRLSSIGIYPEHFDYLHYGTGAALFGWAGLISAGLLAAFGVTRAVARQI